MPKLSDAEYATQNTKTLELANRSEGVTIGQIIDQVGCSRPRATDLVKNLKLVLIKQEGRTQFFGGPGASPLPTPTAEPKASKPAAKKSERSELEVAESRVRKLAADLEVARTNLILLRSKQSEMAPAAEQDVTTDVVQVAPEAPVSETPAPAAENPVTAEAAPAN